MGFNMMFYHMERALACFLKAIWHKRSRNVHIYTIILWKVYLYT